MKIVITLLVVLLLSFGCSPNVPSTSGVYYPTDYMAKITVGAFIYYGGYCDGGNTLLITHRETNVRFYVVALQVENGVTRYSPIGEGFAFVFTDIVTHPDGSMSCNISIEEGQ